MRDRKVILRADGNSELGLGHIVRCLTLADELKNGKLDCEILFLTQFEEGRRMIEERGYDTLVTQDDEVNQIRNLGGRETLLITDFLDTDGTYISRIKKTGNLKVICIDNNTRLKKIDADAVINANVFDTNEAQIASSNEYYLGPKYMILRKGFNVAHNEDKEIKDRVETILVMSGGADFAEESLILNSFKAIENISEEIQIHLIIGSAFQFVSELDKLLAKTTGHFKAYFDPPNLIDIMKGADIAITAAGIALYELSTLGIPAIVVPQVTPKTSHQEDIANAFEQRGACVNLGRSPSAELLFKKMLILMGDKSLRERLSDNGRALVDGRGLERALQVILKHFQIT